MNVVFRIDVPVEPSTSVIDNDSKARLKRGIILESNDQNTRKRKFRDQNDTMEKPHIESQDLSNYGILKGSMNLRLLKIMKYS